MTDQGDRRKQDSRPHHGRLWAEDRRRQILAVAAQLLEDKGVDGLRIPDIAAAAGVTRPIIYRHFPNRRAILMALLEDFGARLALRIEAHADRGLDDVPGLIRAIFETICDAVDDQGVGVWNLLNSAGPDPEIEAVAQGVRERLTRHWFPRVVEVVGADDARAAALTAMIAATIPALVALWKSGGLTRDEAVSHLVRGADALVAAFRDPQ